MQYAVSLSDSRNMPQEYVDGYLQHELLKYMGGLSQFYGKRVLFDFRYTKETDKLPYSGSVDIHMLQVDITEINTTRYVDIKPVPYLESKKSRWERFKQFVKGE
jgi:hypothetical protein